MPKIRNPAIGAALAALLAGTTGYCTLTTGNPPPPPPESAVLPPVRLLPEAIVPYPLDDLPASSDDL